jgi:Protein of unknown function (DUF3035)
MSCRYRFHGAGREGVVLGTLGVACALLMGGCSDFKKSIGLEPTMPDEFAVESRAPLMVPPDFDLRPPTPGAPRPQEKSADQQAKDVFAEAGPGEPGKQASDFRLRRSEGGLSDVGARNGQTPDPNAAVGDQSLSSKLLDYGGTSSDSGTVDKRETTPLKGVY